MYRQRDIRSVLGENTYSVALAGDIPMPHRKPQVLTVISTSAPLERAAAYVRMSHESQQYSPHNQMTLIRQYAATHQLSIVTTYSDKGISGLRIENRPGLRALLTDIVAGRAGFSKLLVYDVSRWGRFQDIDESAYYEFICRRQGVDVIYCAEQFGTDNSLFATIGKVLKRGSAAEYSRELSVRSFRGACNIASRGFAVGGVPPYGLSKILVGPDGERIYGPIAGDRKEQTGCRMSYVPGPIKEVRVIREIFRRYVHLRESTREIADFLNASGARTSKGKKWRSWSVLRRLREEKYVGTQVYARFSSKLQAPRRLNPRSQWITKANAFPAIVDPEDFRKAQERMAEDHRRLSDGELLNLLRRFLAKRGALTQRMIRRDKTMPCPSIYVRRFGSLYHAFLMIGYSGRSKYAVAETRFRRRDQRLRIMEQIAELVQAARLSIATNITASWFSIDGRLTCALQLMKCRVFPRGERWHRTANSCIGKRANAAEYHLLVRLNCDCETIRDYYVVPKEAYRDIPTEIKPSRNRRNVDRYRFIDLAAAVDQLIRKVQDPARSRNLVLHRLH